MTSMSSAPRLLGSTHIDLADFFQTPPRTLRRSEKRTLRLSTSNPLALRPPVLFRFFRSKKQKMTVPLIVECGLRCSRTQGSSGLPSFGDLEERTRKQILVD